MEEIVREFLKVEQTAVINTLQEWVNFNKDKSPKTITTWFSYLSKYLRHRGVDLTNVRDNIDFPRYIEEEKYPLSLDDIQKILSVAGYGMKLKLLTQLSSGMRRGEMLQLRKKDLIIGERIIIKIPAKIAKFNKARTTFVSSEVQKILIPKLRGLNDNDFVFGSPDVQEKNIGDSYEQNLIRYLEKLGLDMRYESTGYHKINTHSFRAYFITKMSRHDENVAKILSGQKGYLLQYDRLTVDEKLAKFIEFEPDLYIFKTKPASEEIQELREKINNQEQKQKEIVETIKLYAEMDFINKGIESKYLDNKSMTKKQKTKRFFEIENQLIEKWHELKDK